MENKKVIYFAVKAVIIHEGKILVMHKSNEQENIWELPGGRMEFGETAEDTLIREIIEETGLLVKPVKLLDTWNFVGQEYQITGIIYLCKIEKGDIKLSSEHDSYKWIYADDKTAFGMNKVFRERMVAWDWNSIINN